mgnify:CR=1 FL=1|tara:strand:+ start:70 stop:285 length:216 start_codon:yes stop_codon:yes gene_type:complete
MVETVIALLMFVGGEIKEHRIQDSMSECLKGKREASRNISKNVEFKCIKSKVELETNIDGSKSIKKIILGE